jgi:hypothetical protein
MHETSESFTWWHRDELQVYVVYLIIILFFGRSFAVEAALLAVATLPIVLLWVVRWMRRTGRKEEGISRILTRFPPHPWDRSRLLMSVLSAVIVLFLFGHRLHYFLRDRNAGLTGEESFATPLDLYWLLFLGWYGLVWAAIAVFLYYKWKHHADPVEHKFLEGLVGSMYFYHGLPTRSRVVTFVAGFLLGGLPTAYAVQLDPLDPNGMTIALLLIIPVATLILFGGWFASRWVGTTPSGEV